MRGSYYVRMIEVMERLSISIPEELAHRIRQAARSQGGGLSAWLARAAEHQLLLDRAEVAIAAWEEEHGPITDAEIAKADRAWRA